MMACISDLRSIVARQERRIVSLERYIHGGCTSQPSTFEELPTELWGNIASSMTDARDVLSVAMCCRDWYTSVTMRVDMRRLRADHISKFPCLQLKKARYACLNRRDDSDSWNAALSTYEESIAGLIPGSNAQERHSGELQFLQKIPHVSYNDVD